VSPSAMATTLPWTSSAQAGAAAAKSKATSKARRTISMAALWHVGSLRTGTVPRGIRDSQSSQNKPQ
jgi:hypothetical protein